MKKYNVLHIITKLELGGAQQNTLDSVRYLDRTKYNLYLVTGADGFLVAEAKEIRDAKIILMPELKHEISPLYDTLCLIKLIKLFRKEKIDIVHTHSSKAGILGRFAAKIVNVPIIIHTIHGFSFNKFQNFFIRNFYVLLERIAACFTDILIAVTRKDIDKGLEAKVGRRKIYRVIRSGIDIEKFKNTEVELSAKSAGAPMKSDVLKKKEELKIKNINWNVIGMVACFKPQKSPLDFIRVADLVVKEFPETYFLLVGDGVLRFEIEELIKKLNLNNNVILTGWRNDVHEIIKIFDIFVLSSLWEGLPRTVLQAFASGVPVVATNVDGTSEVIKDGVNGYLVEPHDYLKISEKVKILLKDKELSMKIGLAGFNTLGSEFDYREMVKNIDYLYTELLDNGKNR